jgi:hypothetical protein
MEIWIYLIILIVALVVGFVIFKFYSQRKNHPSTFSRGGMMGNTFSDSDDESAGEDENPLSNDEITEMARKSI